MLRLKLLSGRFSVDVVLEDLDLSLVDVVQDKLELGGDDPVRTV